MNIIDIKFTESSPTEPVTTAEVKTHCKIDGTDEDTYIGSLITQVRRRIENLCGISIVTKTVILTAGITCDEHLPYGPVSSITEVKYQTGNDATTGAEEWDTITGTSDYYTNGQEYKIFKPGYGGTFQITYTAGYSTVPDDLKLAVLNECAYRFQNRGDQSRQYVAENPGLSESTKELVHPYKRFFGI
jgi:uncharacterized phiE125 gp8 family phage protein